ncbi:hypothetical protein [Sphingomonas nostoxanthinifaciens]|uniref:hypothetical protein n=1 Tax=Sphingomonas nostoxanthinifaciens TaxID=2872652 RepID=UPI001CC2192A|nr:hypothetical protein [Sphingomonas nostoxanthinifaciens]UAK26006.1 hypothetical protein K8P63_07815 [Sphingomonas nostoxanthinifaciens]
MLNLLSLGIGVVAIVPVLFALLPLLGWANWFILPLPVVGLAIGTLSRYNSGRNLNLVVLIVAVLRLMLGHGIF